MVSVDVEVTPDFKKKYDNMNDKDFRKRGIDDLIVELETNRIMGDYIKKRPWPKRYLRQDISNLYRYPIGSYRVIYTIRTGGEYRFKTYQLLDFLTHKEYEIIFGYTN